MAASSGADGSGGASGEPRGIDLMTLPVQQLAAIKEQLEGQIEQFSAHFNDLQVAITGFHASGLAVEGLANEKDGKDVLVPLTSSLYVPGQLSETDKVMVDIGTGYYVETSAKGGVDYCKRKVTLLTESLSALAEMIQQKRRQVGQIQHVMQMKMQQQQQQQQQQQSAS